MKYSIQSADLTVEINAIGMELCSIKSNLTQTEYIWQADPSIWKGSAPVLFPIIGALKDGLTLIKGKVYSMPKHGLVRNSTKPTLIERTETSLKFRLTWDEESLQNYPFKFELDMVFRLEGKTLSIEHIVTNLGNEIMPYSIGGHPAFNCPLVGGEEYEDYFLEFEHKETDSTWMVEPSGLIGLNQKLVLDNTKTLRLNKHLFDDDALIFKGLKSREVKLCHKSKGTILSMKFDDFDYLGIWAKPAAPFVCIEPWLGIGDSSGSNQKFTEKEGLLFVEPNQSETKSYSITVA
ncbi:Galactose mutarotase [Algoriphagus locisalis]|uniref:Galactose mutarotase n=1 Tax=Algoriphagus locisalis TaxID=305507 RepID=A0A1I6YDQ7_9BACT|nr:aldose 1-epimerase family protein [Algoriphagus locisalis]SFT48530.1 Galactose mutarotase [Algoriphagus locisalis]